MNKEPTFKEILDYINSGHENLKANCSIGLFLSDYYEETIKEVDNFIVKKPMVTITAFLEENEIFYDIGFHFKSYNDVDYKQMWKFICKFTERAKKESMLLEQKEKLEKVSVLSVSIIPEKYNGKYFAYINMPLYATLSRTENAYDGSAVISFVAEESAFGVLSSDDDVIDKRAIEREVEQELLAEQNI